MKLTKSAIDAMVFDPAKGKFDVRWDDALSGFGVRVWPSGKKVFLVRYRALGRKRYLTLGAYGVLTLDQARDMAKLRLAEVLQGKDPLQEKRRAVAKRKTVCDLCDTWLERHAELRKRSVGDDEQRIRDYVKPQLGHLQVVAVSRADVARMHDRIGAAHPTTANRVLALVKAMFNKAPLWGFALPPDAPNPAAGVEHFAEEKRERHVTAAEMPALVAAIEALPNVYARAALWLYLLTGFRKNEVLTLRWDAVNLLDGTIRLAKTKQGKPHTIPIPPAAVELLRSVPREYRNPYVICGKKARSHMVFLEYWWYPVRKKAGLDDVRIHDLRHRLASWLVNTGATLDLVGRILGHADSRTTQRYAHWERATLAAALTGHADRLKGKSAEDDEVVTVQASPVS